MTREEAKDKVVNYALGLKVNDGINTMEELIDAIFDEHEKEKEHWVLHCDGLVSAHKHQCEVYEAQLRNLHVQYADAIASKKALVDDVFNLTEQLKAKNKLAHKMCAMLFWEWKKHKQTLKEKRDEENNETPSRDSLAWFWIVAQSEMLFKKAYAMLKATT